MSLSVEHRRDARALAALVVVLGLLAVAASKTVAEPLAQPLAWQALPEGNIYEYSGLSATGLIYEINRTRYNIAVISAKPFWAPKPRVVDRVALWPASTLLIVHISNGVPIIINGKKVGFAQLAPGQTISVQYSVYHSMYGDLGCGARRIQVHR